MADDRNHSREFAAQKNRFREYQVNPLAWVQDFFGDSLKNEYRAYTGREPMTLTGLTKQQEEAFTEMGKIVAAKWKEYENKKMTDDETAYARKMGLSIQSGQGTGKDFFAAITMLWFLMCFKDCKNAATANTKQQLKNVYWSELSKVMRLSKRIDPNDPNSPPVLEYLFDKTSEKLFYRERKGQSWFCEAVTINTKADAEDQGQALAGRHERFMLFVFDEASGINDAVFKPVEGTLTGVINLVLIIYNPTKRTGFAMESNRDKERFVTLWWNSEDSEAVSKAHVEGMAAKYGKDSNPYRIRVLGLPPVSDTDALIPYNWIMGAVDRELEVSEYDPQIIAADVGGGGDKSVVVRRQGGKILSIKRSNDKDTMILVGFVANELDAGGDVAVVDNIGIGHGVVNRLDELDRPVVSGDVRTLPDDELHFVKKRDEIWWKVRTMFEKNLISIPDDRDLIDQLSIMKFSFQSDGRVKVISKQELRSKGLGSPDEADAVMLSYFVNDILYAKQRPMDGSLRRGQGNRVDRSNVFMR